MFICRRFQSYFMNNNAIEIFKQELYKTSWDDVIKQ